MYDYAPHFVCSAYHCTGKERDNESRLDYFDARYYGSSMGRFMSPDPSGLYYADQTNPQSLNLYGYVRNNPLIYLDPTGMTCQQNPDDGVVYDDGDGKGCDAVDQQNNKYLQGYVYDAQVGSKKVDGNENNDDDLEDSLALNPPMGWNVDQGFIYPNQGNAPNSCPGCSKANQTPRQCADEIANTWSLTQAVPNSVMNVPVLGGFLNGVLGNTVTNFTGFFSGSVANSYGTMLGAGPTMLPLPSGAPTGLQGPVGVLIGAVATGAGKFIGASKAILDVGIYAEALNYCKTGKY